MSPNQINLFPLCDRSPLCGVGRKKTSRCSNHTDTTEHSDVSTTTMEAGNTTNDFYMSATKKLFPYHIVVNQNFQITSFGNGLSRVLDAPAQEILGHPIDEVLSIVQPRGAQWSWGWLRLRGEQTFMVEPAFLTTDLRELRFKANAVHIADTEEAMINLLPDARSIDELVEMSLTLEDIPAHSGHRENFHLRERLSSLRTKSSDTESNNVQVIQLRKALSKETELLENLIPKHVAEGLRRGESVAPREHKNVTFFFSDVKGFTDMAKQLYPWQVIGMLNRLYCVMDHLAEKFNLFKVETIGDAYVCCSGLPHANDKHAENVANFAIAVSHCVRQVLSPVDGSPIELRIGIHTGSAASGVVGVTNPRYCVFGDTVNVTARHESSGEAGRVHCSAVTQMTLEKNGAKKNYNFIERGLVEMKGKGSLKTFWVEASEANKLVNSECMAKLNLETEDLLNQTKFDSQLERENSEKSLRLMGQLEQATCNGSSKEVMGPILDIIRRELSSKSISRNNSMNDSQRSLGSQHSLLSAGGSPVMSSRGNAEWDMPVRRRPSFKGRPERGLSRNNSSRRNLGVPPPPPATPPPMGSSPAMRSLRKQRSSKFDAPEMRKQRSVRRLQSVTSRR